MHGIGGRDRSLVTGHQLPWRGRRQGAKPLRYIYIYIYIYMQKPPCTSMKTDGHFRQILKHFQYGLAGKANSYSSMWESFAKHSSSMSAVCDNNPKVQNIIKFMSDYQFISLGIAVGYLRSYLSGASSCKSYTRHAHPRKSYRTISDSEMKLPDIKHHQKPSNIKLYSVARLCEWYYTSVNKNKY